jgi:predicted TIM-barrel fold metal-dependent hydrolase
MIIDCHGHASLPPHHYAYKAGLLSHRGAHGRAAPPISDELLERSLTTSTFGGSSHLEQLREVGTDIQFISPRPFQLMHSEKPEKLVHWWVEETNNLIARQCQMHPEVFRGVAGLPQNMGVSPANSVAELERSVKELGFVGCLLNPDPNEGEAPPPPGLGEEYWYPLYEKLVELDVPAMIHTAGCRIPREPYTLHFVTEETIAIHSLLGSRVFQDFPTLKLIVPHGGGAIPYQVGRFMAARYRQANATPYEEALRRVYLDSCLYTQDALELLIKVAGPDRVLFGSERPGTGTAKDPKTGEWMDDVKAMIDRIEWLGDADRRKIYEENARSLFKL